MIHLGRILAKGSHCSGTRGHDINGDGLLDFV